MRKHDAHSPQDTSSQDERSWTPPRLTVMDVRADTAGSGPGFTDAQEQGSEVS
jgi:hypothetical protein